MNTTWSNLTEADWIAALRPLIDSTFRAGMLAGMAVAAEAVDDAPAAAIRAMASDTGPSQAETVLLGKPLKLMRGALIEVQWLAAIADAERRWLDASLKGRCHASRARYVLFGLWPLIELARHGQ